MAGDFDYGSLWESARDVLDVLDALSSATDRFLQFIIRITSRALHQPFATASVIRSRPIMRSSARKHFPPFVGPPQTSSPCWLKTGLSNPWLTYGRLLPRGNLPSNSRTRSWRTQLLLCDTRFRRQKTVGPNGESVLGAGGVQLVLRTLNVSPTWPSAPTARAATPRRIPKQSGGGGAADEIVVPAKVKNKATPVATVSKKNTGGAHAKWLHEPSERRPQQYKHGPITGRRKRHLPMDGREENADTSPAGTKGKIRRGMGDSPKLHLMGSVVQG